MKYLHVFLDGSRSEEKELYAVSPENKSSTYSNLSKHECWQFEKSYCKSTTINIEWNFYRYKQWPKQRIPLKHYWTILYLKNCRPNDAYPLLSGWIPIFFPLWVSLGFERICISQTWSPLFLVQRWLYISLGVQRPFNTWSFHNFKNYYFKWFLTFTDIDTVKLEVIVHDL